jgi:uncharacterized protein YraI
MRHQAARVGRSRRVATGMVALALALGGVAGTGMAQVNPAVGGSTRPGAQAGDTAAGTIRTLGSGSDSGSEATGSGAVTYYGAPQTMYATTSARVRSGPGTGHEPLGSIPYGGQVTVLGQAPGGDWVYLEMADGTRGYTAARLLSTVRPTASSGGGGTTTTTAGSQPVMPVCVSGQVLIDMGDGTSICATLQ